MSQKQRSLSEHIIATAHTTRCQGLSCANTSPSVSFLDRVILSGQHAYRLMYTNRLRLWMS